MPPSKEIQSAKSAADEFDFIQDSPLMKCSQSGWHYRRVLDVLSRVDALDVIRDENSAQEESILIEQLEKHIATLRNGQYIDSEGVLTLKGRSVAEVCSIFITLCIVSSPLFVHLLLSPLLSFLTLSLSLSPDWR